MSDGDFTGRRAINNCANLTLMRSWAQIARVSSELSHIDSQGQARMVDVSDKPATQRTARAQAFVRLNPEAIAAVRDGATRKGDVLGAARIAGITAAKQTSALIPLCHLIALSHVDIDLQVTEHGVDIRTQARATAQTGVEMEALTAAAVAALTVYDMVKSVQRDIVIERVRLLYKEGGRRGTFVADATQEVGQ